ncbi:MAG: penicillin acylase family protein [Flavobacteriales bacterium]|nr:penicillin acylase family protein [Flavobacteriales bacterium]
MKKFFTCLALVAGLSSAVLADDGQYRYSITVNPEDVTIVRDKWGVPHIFGKTDADAAYGLAWANAEDDFFTMQELVITGKGLAGKLLGVEGAERDFFTHAIGYRERVEKDWHLLSDDYIRYIEGYCQGINAYAKAHKKEIRVRGTFPVTPKDIVGSYMFALSALIGTPGAVGNVMNGTYDRDQPSDKPYGSNAFAFNSNKTEDGSSMLCINPHQPVTGPFSWYEAHLQSDEGLNIHGAMFPGSSTVFLGNNENLGWAHTFNHLDLVDVFQLEMHPKKKRTYRYNGEWHELEKRPVWLKVKLAKGIVFPVKRMTYWSKYGATLESPNGNFYAVKLPANERVRVGEQWYRMDKASNFEEFYAAMQMESISMFNVIYADKEDNIMYLNNAVVPRRNPEVDYTKVVRSNSDKTLWHDFHDVEDMVQTTNPKCGWVFNTNNNPAHATAREEWQDIDDYPSYFGWGDDLGMNNRAMRFLELMDEPASEKISFQRMKDMKFDYEFPTCSPFQKSLDHLFAVNADEFPELKPLITAINNWDKEADKDSKGAAAWVITFQKVFSMLGFGDGEFKKEVIVPDTTYLKALRWAKNQIDTYYGGKIPKLGDVQRHVRGEVNLPLGGFPDALAANYNEEWKDGRYKPWVADSYVHFVQWKQGELVRMETLHPFGASNRTDSPHYTDQMELYANQETKKMSLNKDKIFAEAERVYHPKP